MKAFHILKKLKTEQADWTHEDLRRTQVTLLDIETTVYEVKAFETKVADILGITEENSSQLGDTATKIVQNKKKGTRGTWWLSW